MMNIRDAKLKFTRALTARQKTTAVVLHHRAGEGDVESIHKQHLVQGWAGIGYNFYIRLDGSIYYGRGWSFVGAHAGSGNDYNSKSIGICFEGNYDARREMPAAQYAAGMELIREARIKYPGIIEVVGHRDISATACPGRYFPLEKMINDAGKEIEDMPDIKEIAVRVGSASMQGKLIDGVTYIPLRDFIEKLEAALTVTYSAEQGPGVELK